MFDTLSDKLQGVFSGLRGRGKLTDADIDQAMRAIRLSLLEADVSLPVVKQLTGAIGARARGAEVMTSLTPDQQVVKIVNEELAKLMGGASVNMPVSPRPPTVILMAGLQGSGKTTCSAKLARYYQQQGRAPMLDRLRCAPPGGRRAAVGAWAASSASRSIARTASPMRWASRREGSPRPRPPSGIW